MVVHSDGQFWNSYSLYGRQAEDEFEGSEVEDMETNWKAFPIVKARNRAWTKAGALGEREGVGLRDI